MKVDSLVNLVKNYCTTAIKELYPELSGEIIDVTAINLSNSTKKLGDYQFNSAMKFSKIIQQNPRDLANNLLKILYKNNDCVPVIFSRIEVAGAGFINFTLNPDFLAENLKFFMLNHKFKWEQAYPNNANLKIVIDFSSPNIAKEMHVGHLRSTIIGDCIARVLEYLGCNVLRLNHIGDWGTQFGMLIAYLKLKNYTNKTLSIEELVDSYKSAKVLFDHEINFKKQAQQEVVALQHENITSIAIWEKICEISRKNYNEIYQILNINLIERGESFYKHMLPEVITDLAAKNLLVNSEGAECVYLPDFTGKNDQPLPLIVKKSDGGYNYATTDLAAIKHRVKIEDASWIIYVTDNGQTLHFSMVFAVATKVGYVSSNTKLTHVPFGLVLRSDGKKFKTREGDTFKLKDLIDDAIVTTKKILIERNPAITPLELQHLANIIAINAIKYADLANHRNSNYIFDSTKMLQFSGNTAAFLSYAYVRIKSIKTKLQLNLDDFTSSPEFNLITPEESELALHLCKFNDYLNEFLENLLPNKLTDYLYALAEKFHSFFHKCKVIGSENVKSRILLCELVAQRLEQGFNLLGLQVIDKM